MSKKDVLKGLLNDLSKVADGLASLKNSLKEGRPDMSKTQEELDAEEASAKAAVEATLKAEAEAKEKAEAEAKLAEETRAAEEAKAAAKCPECGGPMSEDETCAGKCGDKKSKATVEEAEAQIVELNAKLEAAEAKIQLLTQESEAKIVETANASKLEAIKNFASAKIDSALATELGLDESLAAVASQFVFADLVKTFVELTKEMASIKEEQSKLEVGKLVEARYNELAEAGIAFKGEKAEEQKAKIAAMPLEAFASYKSDLQAIATSVALNPEEVIRKAKEAAGAKSVTVTHTTEDKYDKYSRLN